LRLATCDSQQHQHAETDEFNSRFHLIYSQKTTVILRAFDHKFSGNSAPFDQLL
jgi:hypothetical protein